MFRALVDITGAESINDFEVITKFADKQIGVIAGGIGSWAVVMIDAIPKEGSTINMGFNCLKEAIKCYNSILQEEYFTGEFERRILEVMGEDYDFDKDSLSEADSQRALAIIQDMPMYRLTPGDHPDMFKYEGWSEKQSCYIDLVYNNRLKIASYVFVGNENLME